MTLLLIALALAVLVLFLFFVGPNVPRRGWGYRRRLGPARFGRGPITGRWGRRL